MILECRDLSKSFYTKRALDEVSLKWRAEGSTACSGRMEAGRPPG